MAWAAGIKLESDPALYSRKLMEGAQQRVSGLAIAPNLTAFNITRKYYSVLQNIRLRYLQGIIGLLQLHAIIGLGRKHIASSSLGDSGFLVNSEIMPSCYKNKKSNNFSFNFPIRLEPTAIVYQKRARQEHFFQVVRR